MRTRIRSLLPAQAVVAFATSGLVTTGAAAVDRTVGAVGGYPTDACDRSAVGPR